MKRYLLLVPILFSFALHAETKTFIREYTYTAGEADSKITSRTIALEQVKRILLEEIGAFLHSEMTTMKKETNDAYSELTTQQISTITAGVTETKIIEERWNGEKYYIKASVTVDPDDVNKRILKISEDQSKLKELEEIKRKAEDAYAEIERLQKVIADAKSENEKMKQMKEYQTASNALSASDWFQKAYQLVEQKKYQEGITAYTKTIELNPGFSEAYNNRGVAKQALEEYSGAIADYSKAIELKKNYADAYSNRGSAKYKLQDNRGAVEDYNRAIELKPGIAILYFNRGASEIVLGDFAGALADCSKAIELKPDYVKAYINRAVAKNMLQDYRGTIEDCTKAISLMPDNAVIYVIKGNANFALHEAQEANADFTNAIELKSDFADAFFGRARAKNALHDFPGAIADAIRVTELAPEYAMGYYNLSCYYALNNERDRALQVLERCLQKGFNDFQLMDRDTDLDNIRSTDEFKALMEKYKKS